jgi:hypothetical protein
MAGADVGAAVKTTVLRSIEDRCGQFLGEVMENDLVEVLHGLEDEITEVGSQVVP